MMGHVQPSTQKLCIGSTVSFCTLPRRDFLKQAAHQIKPYALHLTLHNTLVCKPISRMSCMCVRAGVLATVKGLCVVGLIGD